MKAGIEENMLERSGFSTARRLRYRSACLLGNPVVEDTIRRELDRQFPADRFPVNIDVVGSQNNTHVVVRVTNFDHAINVSENAVPEDFGFDILSA